MQTIREPQRPVPVLLRADAAVVGGGPAGVAAAVAAAQAGASVVLIERYGFSGGGLTVHGGEPVWRAEALRGVAKQLFSRMRARGAAVPPFLAPSGSVVYGAESLKYVLDGFLEEHGVRPVYHALVTGLYREGGGAAGVFLESKSGRGAVLAGQVVDCTGDAAFAAGCGARTAGKGAVQMTLAFGACQVEVCRVAQSLLGRLTPDSAQVGGCLDAAFSMACADGLPRPACRGRGLSFRFASESAVPALSGLCVPLTDGGLESVAAGEMALRREALAALGLLRRYEPGFSNAALRSFAASARVWDPRRVAGGAALPEGVRQHAGRLLSAGGAAWGFGRLPRADAAMQAGQAAGILAALAVRLGCQAKEVPDCEFDGELRRQLELS